VTLETRSKQAPPGRRLALVTVTGIVALTLALQSGGRVEASPRYQRALVTQFASKTIGDPLRRTPTYDKQAGQWFACLKDGRKRRMSPYVWGIAARQGELPCGALVELCREFKGRSLCVVAPVVDRGPYHAVRASCPRPPRHSQVCWSRGKTMLRQRPGWRWETKFDLLPRVAWAIRVLGKGMVWWRVVWSPLQRRRDL